MKSKTYIIKITGKNQICSFINKKSTLDQTKQLVSALADTMDWPKTLMVFESKRELEKTLILTIFSY